MPHLYESQPMTIGKHEWRVIVRPHYQGGNCLEYQWRRLDTFGLPAAFRDPWRGEEEWPGWNGNDTYCGLPRTLEKLYRREKAALDRHLRGIAPLPDAQASLDF
jgi:hypothetical protein